MDRRRLDRGCRPLDDGLLHGRRFDMAPARRGHSTPRALPCARAPFSAGLARPYPPRSAAQAAQKVWPHTRHAARPTSALKMKPLRLDRTGMADGLGANAYSVSRCLAMAATPPL